MKISAQPKIGIFWVYKNQVIGKTCELNKGRENVPGLIDSPDSHIKLWEQDPDFVIPFPELAGSEYQDIPRGRVIYSTKNKQAIVYMDKVLHTDKIKEIIADFFQLTDSDVVWKTDDHYTTQSNLLDDLFVDEDSETDEFEFEYEEEEEWESPLPETEVGGYVFVPLTTLEMLEEEDSVMGNDDYCWVDYKDGFCWNVYGASCIFSVRDLNGNRIATAVYVLDSNLWHLRECVGVDGVELLYEEFNHSIDENSNDKLFYFDHPDIYYVAFEIERLLNLTNAGTNPVTQM